MWLNERWRRWMGQALRQLRRCCRSLRMQERLTVEALEDRRLLTAYSAAAIGDLVTDIGLTNQNGGTNTIALTAAGNANPNDLFRYDPSLGGYLFNLSTKGLAAGTYTLYYTAGNDPTRHSLLFVVD